MRKTRRNYHHSRCKTRRKSLSYTNNDKQFLKHFPSKPKYLVHSTEYPENLEAILKDGIRSSSNTGYGRFKYNNVKILTRPKSKKSSNTIHFNSVFTELLFDPHFKFNLENPLPNYYIFLDMNLIKDLCKDDGCHLAFKWLGGKKIKDAYITYNSKHSLDSNLKSWTKYIKSHAPDALFQNELVFTKNIHPKYIKAVLLLPAIYNNYYFNVDENDELQVLWKDPITKKIKDIYTMYLYQFQQMKLLEQNFPHIKFVYTWEDLDEALH